MPQNLSDLIRVHHVAPTPAATANLPIADILLRSGQVAIAVDGHRRRGRSGRARSWRCWLPIRPRPRREHLWPAPFVGPAVLGFPAFKLVPIVASFAIGLTDSRMTQVPNWAGLANFRRFLFDDPLIRTSLRVTLTHTAFSVPPSKAVGLAVVLHARTRGVKPMVIIAQGGLQGIPRDLHEAVGVDGGNAWQTFRHITVPILTPVILSSLVIVTSAMVPTIIQAVITTEGGPSDGSLFMLHHIHRAALQFSQMGQASAMSWAFVVPTCTIGFLLMRASRSWVFHHGAR